MHNLEEIIQKLKQAGFRITAIRKAVAYAIFKSKKPLAYFDIQKILSKNKISANKATIYRELAFLKEQKIIRELQLIGESKYYELMPKGHHHHVICQNCQIIDHVELEKDLKNEEAIILKNIKFKILTHSLEFYGLCQKCQ